MTDVAIRASRLTKVYRLYAKPAYRFLDMFGMLGNRPGAYTEHAALDGVDLEVRRGEKVAIIGRNGAGKSTFLKLVTNVISPTSGSIAVNGEIHALLQIGTGFHPDFTGRENVLAYLAQLGVSGADAQRRCADAIAFAELEEYIDQPVKTYSTGMAMRLMFSASTAITPDLLVLDEVLGVGDAYFAQKSYERMRDLCERNGATLLLVTHDIYSATKMCDRVVWFDRGVVAMDGGATEVVKAYEESIRAQEERRLRMKTQAAIAAAARDASAAGDTAYVLIEIRGAGGRPQPSPVHFGTIAIVDGGREIARAPLAGEGAADAGSRLVHDGTNWGEAREWHGRPSRPMLNYGAPFHKIAAVVAVPRRTLDPGGALEVVVDYWSDAPCELDVRCHVGDRVQQIGGFVTKSGAWTSERLAYRPGAATPGVPLIAQAAGVQGAGDIVITECALVNAAGERVHTVRHGEPISLVAAFRVVKPRLRERAQVFVVVSRNNTERVCKFMTDRLTFDHAESPEGVVELRLRRMPLGKGTYSIAIEIAAEGYIEKGITKFFSVDPEVYHCLTHALEFTVTDSGWIGDGTIFEGEGEWSLRPTAAETRVG